MSQQQNTAPPPPPVPGYKVRRNWGALAYSPSNGAWWLSSNLPKKDEAGKSVLSNCSQQSGGACQLMITYSNQCAAVARASDGGRDLPGMDSVNTGSNRDEASKNAPIISHCKRRLVFPISAVSFVKRNPKCIAADAT